MKKNILFLALMIIDWLFLWPALWAQSYYNTMELGNLLYSSDAQAMGMGGTFIAVTDGFQINIINPAGLVFTPVTRLSGDFVHQGIWSKSRQGTGFSKYTNLNGIALAIPLKSGKLVTAFSLNPISQFDFEHKTASVINQYNYDKIVQAKGGLNNIAGGIGFSPHHRVAIGAAINCYFGKLEYTWKVDYVSDLFWDVSDQLTRKMWGSNLSAGILLNPAQQFFVGGFFSASYDLTSQDHIQYSSTKGSTRYTIHTYDRGKNDWHMPENWGIGLSYIFKTKFRLSSDFVSTPWSNFKIGNQSLDYYRDSNRLGTGFEILPSANMLAKYFEKMSYRLGYYYQKLHFLDDNGNEIVEHGFTVGFGFPYYGSLGRIDLAIKYSIRGNLANNPVKENIMQILLSINGGEKWFYRGEQR